MLELQNICYRVSTPDGEQDILKNVSITIPDHKLVVFTGPNGGGRLSWGWCSPRPAAYCITART